MVVKTAELETVCGITSTIPDNSCYEVAFAGKSNVGKSSLINGLLNRNGLARTSSQPGKTQTINFYHINQAFYLVDLPGYGYARANEEIKAQWGVMIENYLHTSKMLRAVFLLVDIRHDPSENDCLMYEWMVNQGFAPIIIATKADKVKPSQINSRIRAIEETLSVETDTVIIPFSAETKLGKNEIWEIIETLVFPEGIPESCMSAAQVKEMRRQAEPDPGREEPRQDALSKGEMPAAPALPAKKERWKKTDRPVAKKTQKKRDAKKKSRK